MACPMSAITLRSTPRGQAIGAYDSLSSQTNAASGVTVRRRSGVAAPGEWLVAATPGIGAGNLTRQPGTGFGRHDDLAKVAPEHRSERTGIFANARGLVVRPRLRLRGRPHRHGHDDGRE